MGITIILTLEESINNTSQLLLKPNFKSKIGIIIPTKEVMGPVNHPNTPEKLSSLSPDRYI